MNWRDLRSEVHAACRVPEVIADRCVHSHAEVGSCRRCADACPTSAWVLDDEQLAIDAAACDGCGLCAAVCPEGALSNGVEPELRRLGGEVTAFAACERVRPDVPDAPVPCVHAFGLVQLAALYRNGVRRLLVCVGECADCPRGGGERLVTRLAVLNRVLAQRGLPGMVVTRLTVVQWCNVISAAPRQAEGPTLSRRGFLRSAVAVTADSGLVTKPLKWRPPGAVLPRADTTGMVFFAPQLDPMQCDGCDGCARVCPHSVIQVSEQGDAYEIHADACTGCNLCADVCDRGAVRVEVCALLETGRLSLRAGRCRACGADFHRPLSSAANNKLCQVCAATGHHRNLFQIV